MKILLIGATGQIGYSLANALSKTNHRVSVLIRNRIKRDFPNNVKVMEFGEFHAHVFRSALLDVDHVIYGVGLPEQFLFNSSQFENINYGLLKTFLEEFQKSGIKSLTYISTYEVFQDVEGIIRESEQVADESEMTPYFRAMTKAYRLVSEYFNETKIELTTIHPAAVYGGLNTGHGFTDYIDNLVNKRFWLVPFIIKGRFPVVHVESLANAIIRSLGYTGSYIVSDQMTTLKEIAQTVKKFSDSYVPIVAPLWMSKAGASFLEIISRFTRKIPIMSKVQIKFIKKGFEPKSDRAREVLGWQPMSLDEGIKRYLRSRK